MTALTLAGLLSEEEGEAEAGALTGSTPTPSSSQPNFTASLE